MIRKLHHLCYMYPLRDKAPSGDRIVYVLYDFETTQNTECTETTFQHVSKLVYVQEFCVLCEDEGDVDVNFRGLW